MKINKTSFFSVLALAFCYWAWVVFFGPDSTAHVYRIELSPARDGKSTFLSYGAPAQDGGSYTGYWLGMACRVPVAQSVVYDTGRIVKRSEWDRRHGMP